MVLFSVNPDLSRLVCARRRDYVYLSKQHFLEESRKNGMHSFSKQLVESIKLPFPTIHLGNQVISSQIKLKRGDGDKVFC